MLKNKTHYEQIPLAEVLKFLRKAPQRISLENRSRVPS
jgi:hypothetical protein